MCFFGYYFLNFQLQMKFVYFIQLGFVLYLSFVDGQDFYQKSAVALGPEDEMCGWLADNCPYLRTLGRPSEKTLEPVEVNLFRMVAIRFVEMSDLEQKLTIQAAFVLAWKLPKCAVWSQKMLANETNLTNEAKLVTSCNFDSSTMWKPFLRLRNAYSDPASIYK